MLFSSTLISSGILILAGALQLPLRHFSMVSVASSVISPSTLSFEMLHPLIQHLLVLQIPIKFPCRHSILE